MFGGRAISSAKLDDCSFPIYIHQLVRICLRESGLSQYHAYLSFAVHGKRAESSTISTTKSTGALCAAARGMLTLCAHSIDVVLETITIHM